MPQYVKTVWVNGTVPALNDSNLNKIEQGIFDSLRQDGSTTMSGQLVTTAGSAATPAIAPTGDANTGIFFPAADSVALAVGGGEGFRLMANGNVGISQANPSVRLSLGSSTGQKFNVYDEPTSGIGIGMGIDISGIGSYETTFYSKSNAGGNGQWTWGHLNSSNTFSEKMRLTSAGNVGIGTTSPNMGAYGATAKVVTVLSSTGFGVHELASGATPADSNVLGVVSFINNGSGIITPVGTQIVGFQSGSHTSYAGGKLVFYTRANGSTSLSERLTITDSGNVGIGTTSPSKKFTVYSSNNSYDECIQVVNTGSFGGSVAGIKFYTENSTAALTGFTVGKLPSGDGHICTIWNENNSAIQIGTNNLERMRITSGGNVGIGTSSPNGKLHVQSTASTTVPALRVASSASLANNDIIRFQIDGLTNGFRMFQDSSSNLMYTFETGNVGIGTTSPSLKLHIAGSTGVGMLIQDTTLSKTAYLTHETGKFQINANQAINFAESGTSTTMYLTGGNVGIGTSSPAAKLHVSDASASNSNVTIQLTNTQSSKNLILGSSATAFAYQGIGNNDSFVLSDLSNLTLAAWNSSAIKFVTGTTEKARFDSNGYLLIGYTSSNGAYPLQVNGQIFATSSTIATSDGRYKKDVVELDGALDIVKALNPVQFNWKEHPVHKFNTDVPTVGFLAQEVEQALADKSYLTSIIKKSECTWETETGEFVEREVTRDVEKQVTREVEREITETIDGEEVTRTITEEVTETIIEQVTEIVTEPVKETHTEEFLGIAESNLIAILTKAVKELTAKVEALEAQLNGN